MSAREKILNRVRAATESLPDRSPLPAQAEIAKLRPRKAPTTRDPAELEAIFKERCKGVSGVVIDDVAELEAFLAREGATVGYVDPVVLQWLGRDSIAGASTRYERERVDEIQFGITRARCAIAESGTVVLTDADTPNRLAALATWVHVAVVRRIDILATIADAMESFDNDPSIVMVTGPSKTADIEGILIEGVHGPGRQAVVIV